MEYAEIPKQVTRQKPTKLTFFNISINVSRFLFHLKTDLSWKLSISNFRKTVETLNKAELGHSKHGNGNTNTVGKYSCR